MDKQAQPALVDLGDAKAVTQGPYTLVRSEEHPSMIFRPTP